MHEVSVGTDSGPDLSKAVLSELICLVQLELIRMCKNSPNMVHNAKLIDIANYKEVNASYDKGKVTKGHFVQTDNGHTELLYYGRVVEPKVGVNLPRASSVPITIAWDETLVGMTVNNRCNLYIDGSKHTNLFAPDCSPAFMVPIEKAPKDDDEKKDDTPTVVSPKEDASQANHCQY